MTVEVQDLGTRVDGINVVLKTLSWEQLQLQEL
jgi:hypothetical protein